MKLWIGVLEASIVGGLGILVFYMLSTIYRKRCRTKYKKIVWILIILRLLIPINVAIFSRPYVISMPVWEMQENRNNELSKAEQKSENSNIEELEKEENEVVAKSVAKNIFVYIWGYGMCFFFLFYFISYGITRKKIMQQSRECTDYNIKNIMLEVMIEMKIKIEPEIRVMKTSDYSPFMIGIIKQVIFLPDQRYADEDLRYIIKHELIHCKEKDVLYKTIILVVNIIHWFNPLVWWMRRIMEQDMELICDEELLKAATNKERKEYSEIIMSCIGSQQNKKRILSTSYIQGTKYLKRRFANIYNTQKKTQGYVVIAAMSVILVITGGVVHVKEGGKIHFSGKVPIDFGYELRTDLDGDGNEERIHISDNVSGEKAFTQIFAQFKNGENIHKDYPDYWSSYLVSGDLSNNGAADMVVVRISIGSTYGGGVVNILYVDAGEWKEYPSTFIKNPLLEIEQPDNFSTDNGDVSCLGATIIKEKNKTLLRLILNEDIGNDIVKCIDSSYTKDGWYIENIQIISNYYAENKDRKLLNNNLY